MSTGFEMKVEHEALFMADVYRNENGTYDIVEVFDPNDFSRDRYVRRGYLTRQEANDALRTLRSGGEIDE